MIIASVADKWQYIHPGLATPKSSQFQAQIVKMVGETDREKSRENCVGAGKRRSSEACKVQTIWLLKRGGGGGGAWVIWFWW